MSADLFAALLAPSLARAAAAVEAQPKRVRRPLPRNPSGQVIRPIHTRYPDSDKPRELEAARYIVAARSGAYPTPIGILTAAVNRLFPGVGRGVGGRLSRDLVGAVARRAGVGTRVKRR